MRTKLWVIFLVLVATGCTSFSKSMDRIQVGMDKDEVLNQLGNPKRTFRENSLDYWTYLFYENNKEWRRDVVFESGKVIRVTRATLTNKSAFQLRLEQSNTPEEFEAAVRSQQRRNSNFKYLDGLPPEATEKSP